MTDDTSLLAARRDPTRREQWLLFGAGLLASALICLWYGVLDLPIFPRDNQHYFYIAERVSAGLAPHASGFDPKTVVPLLLVGWATALGDLVGIPPLAIARLMSVLTLGVFVGVTGLAAWKAGRNLPAAIFAMLALLACSYLDYMGAVGSQPKITMAMFMALGMWLAFEGRPGWSALFGTLAFLSWQPGLLCVAAAGVVALLSRDRWRAVARVIVAFVVPVALYQLYFWLKGATGEQIEQEYVFPGNFMTHEWAGLPTHLRWVMQTWREGFGKSNLLPFLFLGVLAVFVVHLLRRRRELVPATLAQPAWLYFTGLLLATVTFTIYDHQGPPDFFFLFPYAAVALGLGFALLLPPGGRLRLAGVGLVSLYLLGLAITGRSRSDTAGYRLAAQQPVAAEVKHWLDQGKTVYAVNAHQFLALNRATNWSRYNSFFRGVDEYLQARTGNKEAWVPADSAGRLPDIILLGRAKPWGWPEWLSANGYVDMTPQPWRVQQLRVWRRDGGG